MLQFKLKQPLVNKCIQVWEWVHKVHPLVLYLHYLKKGCCHQDIQEKKNYCLFLPGLRLTERNLQNHVSSCIYVCVCVRQNFYDLWSHHPSLLNPSNPQARDPSNVNSAASRPPHSPTYPDTNVFTPGRNLTDAPGATTGNGSLIHPWLVALMAATVALMITGLIVGG